MTAPTPKTDAAAALARFLQSDGAHLRHCMRDGYTDDDVNRVLSAIGEVVGLRLVCVWDYYDAWGVGGDSDFYVEADDGRLYHMAGDLWHWLNDQPDDPECVSDPGDPASWVGADAGMSSRNVQWSDGWCNRATRDRRGGQLST